MMKRLHEKASITVFLSLLLVLFIGFIMMMTEHARIFGLRQRLVCATDSAMDSLFSMYDRELLNEFDLMLLNENELSNNQDIEEVVSKYLTMNANPKQDHLLLSGNLYRGTSSTAEIENTVSVIENEGELFARSVLEFMKYRTLGIAVESSWAFEGELFARSVLEFMKYRTLGIAVEKVQEQLEELEMGDDAKTMAKEQQELEQESFEEQFLEKTNDEKKKYEEAIEESWLEKLEKLKEDGWLNFVLPFDQAASGYVIEAEDLPSKWRTVNFTWYHSAISEMEESFLFTEYLLEHCRSFTSTGETNKMAYELEYILNGKTTVLSSQAETAAATLVGWTGVYPAIKLTQFTMIAGWSFAEAIVDVRTLLSGGNIPIIKNSESWTLEFSQIADFLDGDLFLTAKENNGLSYDEYLRLLLYVQGRSDRRYHTMDVIQLRMREKNPDFSMADCLGAVQVKASMKAAPIFYCFAGSGYEISCEQSRMY